MSDLGEPHGQTFDTAGFCAALLDADLAPPACIAESDGASKRARFAVYRNNVVQGLVAALETRFPAARRLVGAAFFAALARAFAIDNPPRSPIMTFYGDDFADFIALFAPCAALPYLADLVRLEAARTHAYHAEDAAPLPIEAFSSLAPDALMGLRLKLHPSLFILVSAYPVATIFAMNMGALPLDEIHDWHGEDVIVVRPLMNVDMHRLPAGGAVFLQGLAAGLTLAQAAEAAGASTENFDLTAALALLIGCGLVIEMHT